MKRIFLQIIAIVALAPATLLGQAPKVSIPNIDLGIKVGANLAQLSGNSWDDGYKASYLAGVYAGLRGDKMGVQIEGFFSQSSYTIEGNNFHDLYSGFYKQGVNTAKDGTLRVNYFNIPVLFQYKLFSFLWLQIGPQYSGVVSVKDVDGLYNDAKGLFKTGDLSGVGGLELKLPFHLNIGARYVLGFSNDNNTDIGNAWHNRLIQIHVGYGFL